MIAFGHWFVSVQAPSREGHTTAKLVVRTSDILELKYGCQWIRDLAAVGVAKVRGQMTIITLRRQRPRLA
jgi:hypothetical protein